MSKAQKAARVAAKQPRIDRSALIREAPARRLKHLHEVELEERDRRGYLAQPQRQEEYRIWEDAAVWPRP